MNTRIRNMAIARENKKIIGQGSYETGGQVFHFACPLCRLQEAEIYKPEAPEKLVSSLSTPQREGKISVAEGDTMAYAGEAVLNFANAFTPGGGYLYGASSQEEALCRESTLYASLTGKKGMAYYEENRRQQSIYGSANILLSPFVEIFRRADSSLFGPPRKTAVITAGAGRQDGYRGNRCPSENADQAHPCPGGGKGLQNPHPGRLGLRRVFESG